MTIVPGWAGIQCTLRPPSSCVPLRPSPKGESWVPSTDTCPKPRQHSPHPTHTWDTICSHSGTSTLQTTSLGSIKGPLQNIRTNISSIKEFADIHSQPFLSTLHPAGSPSGHQGRRHVHSAPRSPAPRLRLPQAGPAPWGGIKCGCQRRASERKLGHTEPIEASRAEDGLKPPPLPPSPRNQSAFHYQQELVNTPLHRFPSLFL